jgi:hypothetical protein
MKNAVFWDVEPRRSCVNRGFGEMYLGLQPPAHAGSSLANFSNLKMEVIRSCETSFAQDIHGTTSQMTAFFMLSGCFFHGYQDNRLSICCGSVFKK